MESEIYTVVLVDEDGVCVCAAGIDGVSKEDAEARLGWYKKRGENPRIARVVIE